MRVFFLGKSDRVIDDLLFLKQFASFELYIQYFLYDNYTLISLSYICFSMGCKKDRLCSKHTLRIKKKLFWFILFYTQVLNWKLWNCKNSFYIYICLNWNSRQKYIEFRCDTHCSNRIKVYLATVTLDKIYN